MLGSSLSLSMLYGASAARSMLLSSGHCSDVLLGASALFGDAGLVMHHRASVGSGLVLENAAQLQHNRSATKKAGGSAKQSVGSLPKNLGMKLTAGELAFPGMIILRQRGTKFHPGANVGIGRDHTIFATGVGKVRVDTQPGPRGERRVVSVEPLPEALAAASSPATPGAAAEADSALRLRQVEAELVKRRAEVKRAMLQGRTPLEPALYFPLPRTADGQLSWLERSVSNSSAVTPSAAAGKDAVPAKPKAAAKKAS